MIDEKCFALSKSRDCRALEIRSCPGYKQCAFYKPRWKHERDLSRVEARFSGLSEEKQSEIANKYYHGQMPWRKEQE